MTLIREAVAQDLKLHGERIRVSIVKVGGEVEEFETQIYALRLHSFNDNKFYPIRAIGIGCISGRM